MREHEADIIKICAALTAAPRWVISLMPADGAAFIWASEPAWLFASAILSVLFAIVEVYAASYMMRAWRISKPGSQAEKVLLALWISTLIVLVAVMVPPMYANVMGLTMRSLPVPLVAIWLVCVAASSFLVVGGVGYADKARSLPAVSESKPAQATEKADFICSCGLPFQTQNALNAHKRVHSNGHAVPEAEMSHGPN